MSTATVITIITIDEFITRIVAAAPPPSAEQRDRLAALLPPVARADRGGAPSRGDGGRAKAA